MFQPNSIRTLKKLKEASSQFNESHNSDEELTEQVEQDIAVA